MMLAGLCSDADNVVYDCDYCYDDTDGDEDDDLYGFDNVGNLSDGSDADDDDDGFGDMAGVTVCTTDFDFTCDSDSDYSDRGSGNGNGGGSNRRGQVCYGVHLRCYVLCCAVLFVSLCHNMLNRDKPCLTEL
jgi:hypothetical protein